MELFYVASYRVKHCLLFYIYSLFRLTALLPNSSNMPYCEKSSSSWIQKRNKMVIARNEYMKIFYARHSLVWILKLALCKRKKGRIKKVIVSRLKRTTHEENLKQKKTGYSFKFNFKMNSTFASTISGHWPRATRLHKQSRAKYVLSLRIYTTGKSSASGKFDQIFFKKFNKTKKAFKPSYQKIINISVSLQVDYCKSRFLLAMLLRD